LFHNGLIALAMPTPIRIDQDESEGAFVDPFLKITERDLALDIYGGQETAFDSSSGYTAFLLMGAITPCHLLSTIYLTK
jgi:hypothetical protein